MHVFFAESLETFTADLQRARPTVFFSVPRLWVKFQQAVNAKMPPAKLQRLLRIPIVRGLVSKKILRALGLDACAYAAGGAAPMPPELLRWYARLGLPISEVYGMTENCGVSHATLRGVERLGTVGQPYDGVETRIDPASGEIQMRSPGADARLLQGAGPHRRGDRLPTAGCIPATRARSTPRATCASPAGSRTCSRRARASTWRRRRSRTGW